MFDHGDFRLDVPPAGVVVCLDGGGDDEAHVDVRPRTMTPAAQDVPTSDGVLLNAARLAEEHPALLEFRALQTASTVVVDRPARWS